MVSPLLGHKANDRLRAVATVIGVGLAWVLIAGAFAPSIGLAADDVFTDTNLLRISLEIPETGMAALRAYRWKREDPNPTNRPKAFARVMQGGRVFTNVAVHSKGAFGSFRPIDGLPALTLNFDKFAPGQEFHGMTKLSLNNEVQDPTCIHEKLCRELFAAANVPVPRADYALVTLNGRRLGLYVLTEGFGKRFLKRHFKKANGNLYDPGYLHDVDTPKEIRLDSGSDPGGFPALQSVYAATLQADPEKRFRDLDQVLDTDRFLSMLALEVMLCHWDGYSMNRNNYRIYYDPGSRKLIFMPHGMDQVLGIDRPNLDLELVPPLQGLVANALVSTPEGRRRYLDRVLILYAKLFNAQDLCRRVREIDSKIAAELKHPETRWPLRSRNPQAFIKTSGDHATDIDELCARISTRAKNLKRQLSELR